MVWGLLYLLEGGAGLQRRREGLLEDDVEARGERGTRDRLVEVVRDLHRGSARRKDRRRLKRVLGAMLFTAMSTVDTTARAASSASNSSRLEKVNNGGPAGDTSAIRPAITSRRFAEGSTDSEIVNKA